MLHELTLFTTKSGRLPMLVQRFRDETLPARRPLGGTFRGAWTAEFGKLNTMFVIWEFADAADLHGTATTLGQNAEWVAHTRSLTPLLDEVKGVQTFLLKPFREIARRYDENRLYDFRIYDIQPFHADEYAQHFAEVMPIREKHSKNYCIWTSLAGNAHRIVHLWGYDDVEQRLQVRNAVAAEPEWKAFVAKVFPLIVKQRSSLLRPIPNLIER